MIRRTIHPETRVIDQRKGIVEYVASDETLDSMNEVIRASGWRFTHFKKNAPFVDSHDYKSIEKCLGKVIDFTVKNKLLVETVQWAIDVQENHLAQLGWKMTAAGFLKAVSVGFTPVRTLRNGDKGFAAELADLKLDPAKEVYCIYVEQEQIELSAVLIGANPNAVALVAHAYKGGVLDDGDLDLLSNRWSERQRCADTQRALLSDLNGEASVTSKEGFLRAFQKAVQRA